MNRLLRMQIFYWLPVYLYLILIFYLSSISYVPSVESEIVKGFFIPNYVKHVIEYFILGILLIRASKKSEFKNYFLISIIIIGLYGLSDEVHQLFVPGREFDLVDWFSDIIGGVTSGIIFSLNKLKIKQKGI